VDPRSPYGDLFLDRALHSVRCQTVRVHEICIGVQQSKPELERIADRYRGWSVRVVQTDRPGQAAAMNAAAGAATGDLIAFLEDDDAWRSRRLVYGVKVMTELNGQFVSSNQEEFAVDGRLIGINDFATPSGWLMTADLWRRTGGFDESFRWHLDNEFLGKLLKLKIKRIHLTEKDAKPGDRPWLQNVAKFSEIVATSERFPLVERLQNPKGGILTIASNGTAKTESDREHQALLGRYGVTPW
jgi:glycosyltransferase involved in cell wall biosynthesis